VWSVKIHFAARFIRVIAKPRTIRRYFSKSKCFFNKIKNNFWLFRFLSSFKPETCGGLVPFNDCRQASHRASENIFQRGLEKVQRNVMLSGMYGISSITP
jgi:hypothetical protein